MRFWTIKTMVFPLLALLFIGCPYIDNGTTFAPDSLVNSIEEIQGCFRREYFVSSMAYACEEICIDSAAAYYHTRRYRLDENGGLFQMFEDSSFVSNITLYSYEKDGTVNDAVEIKKIGVFRYYETEDLRKLVQEAYKERDGDTFLLSSITYSTEGKALCDY